MYAVTLRYKAPLTEVDKHVDAHRAWLKDNYAQGHFLLSGPQRPRNGGFILAAAMDRGQLDAILARDPFFRNGIAEYTVIEVAATTTDPRLAFLTETP